MGKYLVETDQGTFEVETEDAVSEQPRTLAEKAVGLTKEFSPAPTSFSEMTPFSGQRQDVLTSLLKPVLALEKYSQPVAEAGRKPFERGIESLSSGISEAGYPMTGKTVGAVGKFGLPIAMPFTPSEFGNTMTLGMGASIPGLAKGTPITQGMREIGGASVPVNFGRGLEAKADEFVSGMGGLTPPMVGGKFTGYLRKVFGEDISDMFTNHFLNTQKPLAETLVSQGKPSLGAQVSEKAPGLLTGKSKQQAFDSAGKELLNLEKQIQQRLDFVESEMKKPVRTQGAAEAPRALEYKPGTVEPSPELLAPDARGSVYSVGREGDPEMIRLGDIAKTQQPGGAKYETLTPGRSDPAVNFSGQTSIGAPLGSASSQAEKSLFLKQQAMQAERAGNLKTNRPGTIDLNEVAKVVDDVSGQYKTGTRAGKVAKINRLKENFLKENDPVLTEKSAMALKRKLDDSVGKAHLASDDAKLAPEVEVEEALANELRKRIYDLDPELGRLSDLESLMIRARTGLKKAIGTSKSGSAVIPIGWFSGLVNRLVGSRYAAGAGLALNKMFGEPSTVAVPLARAAVGSRLQTLSKPVLKKDEDR